MGTLIILGIFVFSLWMFADCVLHNTRDKVFWAILILGTGIIGAVIYSAKRSNLISPDGDSSSMHWEGQPAVAANPAVKQPASTSSQIIRGIGMTIGVLLAAVGLLVVGLVVLFIAFAGSSSTSSSK